jgi:hypothetical protein
LGGASPDRSGLAGCLAEVYLGAHITVRPSQSQCCLGTGSPPDVAACRPFNPRLHSFPADFFAFLKMGWILLAILVDEVYDIGVELPYTGAVVSV